MLDSTRGGQRARNAKRGDGGRPRSSEYHSRHGQAAPVETKAVPEDSRRRSIARGRGWSICWATWAPGRPGDFYRGEGHAQYQQSMSGGKAQDGCFSGCGSSTSTSNRQYAGAASRFDSRPPAVTSPRVSFSFLSPVAELVKRAVRTRSSASVRQTEKTARASRGAARGWNRPRRALLERRDGVHGRWHLQPSVCASQRLLRREATRGPGVRVRVARSRNGCRFPPGRRPPPPRRRPARDQSPRRLGCVARGIGFGNVSRWIDRLAVARRAPRTSSHASVAAARADGREPVRRGVVPRERVRRVVVRLERRSNKACASASSRRDAPRRTRTRAPPGRGRSPRRTLRSSRGGGTRRRRARPRPRTGPPRGSTGVAPSKSLRLLLSRIIKRQTKVVSLTSHLEDARVRRRVAVHAPRPRPLSTRARRLLLPLLPVLARVLGRRRLPRALLHRAPPPRRRRLVVASSSSSSSPGDDGRRGDVERDAAPLPPASPAPPTIPGDSGVANPGLDAATLAIRGDGVEAPPWRRCSRTPAWRRRTSRACASRTLRFATGTTSRRR